MSCSERILNLRKFAEGLASNEPLNTYNYDMHKAAKTKYNHLERLEKIAKSTAYAIENQEIHIEEFDRLIGRVFLFKNKPVEEYDPDFDYYTEARKRIFDEIEDYAEFAKFPQVVGDFLYCGGHMSWDWNSILKLGTTGLKKKCFDEIKRRTDEESIKYYNNVITLLSALENWNDKHIARLYELGMTEQAKICERVPRYPATNFREAIQAFFMQYIVVMRENPGGGNSPGRLDYYLWPYLKRDIANNLCTLEEAKELIDELFIRINERIWNGDGWVETIVVGGSHLNGESSVNPLSFMMIESAIDLEMTHPAVYARISEDSPKEWINYCAEYMINGKNRGQILHDENIIKALCENGVPYEDAVNYYCGGCMEIAVQGKTNDYLFNAWHNMPKFVEFSVTGGLSLSDGKTLNAYRSRGLENYKTFEEFYSDHIKEVRRVLNMFFKAQDIYSEIAEKSTPRFLLTSMLGDCLDRGRGIHSGGVKYSDYGSLPIGLPDAADYLFAIKKAVFDNKICTSAELLSALKADFKGYEELQRALLKIAKYGQENEEADKFASKYFSDISDIYTSYVNRFGCKGKMIIFTFQWAAEAGMEMGATASGKFAHKPLAQGITPHSASMKNGITSAIKSCTSIDFTKFNGGASTMWDLDKELAKPEIVRGLFMTFFKLGGQIFQGNTTDVKELIAAQKNPENYPNLIVRVGGFSARFIYLDKIIQDEIISRIRHNN